MSYGESTSPEEERVAREVVDAALKVHKALGPGLLESAYELCLFHELRLRGLKVERQQPVPVVYEGMVLETSLRLDLIVEGLVIVDTKAKDAILPIDAHKLKTYLRLSGRRLGLLLNFNVVLLKEGGIRRVIDSQKPSS